LIDDCLLTVSQPASEELNSSGSKLGEQPNFCLSAFIGATPANLANADGTDGG
jgi:hypothetical protein